MNSQRDQRDCQCNASFFVTFYTALYVKPESVFGPDNVSGDKIDSVERQQ